MLTSNHSISLVLGSILRGVFRECTTVQEIGIQANLIAASARGRRGAISVVPHLATPSPAAKQTLQEHGGDDDRANRGALPVWGNVQQIKPIANEHHDEHTEQCTDDRTTATE